MIPMPLMAATFTQTAVASVAVPPTFLAMVRVRLYLRSA
jgi:hypothetical protein